MMKKIDILKKIEEQVARGIKNPNLGGDPVGLKITKQALKKSKEENDDYYKGLEKKFKDYMKLDVKDNPSPKVNMTDSDHEMYYGTGMEGLKYDDEGTDKYEKFVERNKELNKPSKDYYLNKDQVSDSFEKIMKDGKTYKKHKYEKPDEYQKTPKVRITKESTENKTMKQLNYKKPFLSYERAMTLIPEGYKTDGNKFKMTDGVESYTIKWEGDTKGTPTVLTYKNDKLVKEDVQKMKHLYDYNSQETLMKTNDVLTENEIFRELMGKSRSLVSEQTPISNQKDGEREESKKATIINNVTYLLPGIKDKVILDKFLTTGVDLASRNPIDKVLGSGSSANVNFNKEGNLGSKIILSLRQVLDAHARTGNTKPHTTYENLSRFVKGIINSSVLNELDIDVAKKQNFMKYYTKLLAARVNEVKKYVEQVPQTKVKEG